MLDYTIYSLDRSLISNTGSAEFFLQGNRLEIIIDGAGLVNITTDQDLLCGTTEDDLSQSKTIDLDLQMETQIILQGGSGTLRIEADNG